MAKKEDAATPDSFPVTLQEYVSGLPKAAMESAKAFQGLLKGEPAKAPEKWAELFAHFGDKPSGTPWPEWVKLLDNNTEVTTSGK